MLVRIFIFSIFLLSPFFVLAGELVRGATIIEVASSSNNNDVFYVKLSGGTGPCANGSVLFPAAKSQSKESYNQAFSIALTAVTSGKKIRIHNYENDTCTGANFIGIYSS